MTRKDFLKKWLPVILTIVLIISLALIFTSCGRSKTTPYGSLSDSKYYANVNGNGWTYKLSEKELYDNVKLDSKDTLIKEIDRIVYKDEIEDYKNNVSTNERYQKYLKDAINNACYKTTDEDTISEYKTKTKLTYQRQYLDSLISAGVNVDETLGSDGLYNIYGQDSINEYYEIDIAKKIYTYNKLSKELDEKYCMKDGVFGSDYCGDDVNIDDIDLDEEGKFPKDFYTDYESDYKGKGNLGAIVISFTTEAEYKSTIETLRLATYGSRWYQIEACTDEKCETDPVFASKWYAEKSAEIKKTNRTDYLKDNEVLAYYLLMYNYMYEYRTSIVFDILNQEGYDTTNLDMETIFKYINKGTQAGADIVKTLSESEVVREIAPEDDSELEKFTYDKLANLDTEDFFTYEYDELSSSTTIRTYIYSTLKAYTSNNEDYSSIDSRYSISSRTQGSTYFIAYKLTQSADKEYNAELRNEIRENMIEDSLTSSEISSRNLSRYEELFKNKEIKIYDPLLEIIYSVEYSAYKKTQDKSSTAVAVVCGNEILVDDFSKTVLDLYGVNTTVDLVFGEYLKHDETYTKQISRDDLVTSYNNYMNYFSNGYYEGYGYPASIGKESFLRIFFNASSMDEAIDKVILPQQLKALYYTDFDNQVYNGKTVYELFEKYTKANYDEYLSLTYQNLLIYIDMDNDGKQDNPYELSNEKLAEYQELVESLANAIKTRIDSSYGVTKATAVSNIVTEYQGFSRYQTQAFRDYAASHPTTSTDWSKYKKAGIQLLLESSATTTNSEIANFATEFADRLKEVYANEPGTGSHWDVDNTFVPFLDTTATMTQFGWHVILFTNGAKATSAKFTAANDTKGIYTNLVYNYKYKDAVTVANAYNDNDNPSANQIEIYIRDLNTGKKVNVNLPSTSYNVYSTVKTYFGSIYTRYTSASYNTILAIKYLKDQNTNPFTTEFNSTRFNKLLDIAERSIDGYIDYEAEAGVYTGWWTDFDYRF